MSVPETSSSGSWESALGASVSASNFRLIGYAFALLSILLSLHFLKRGRAKVLLLDFECFNPLKRHKQVKQWFVDKAKTSKVFSEESLDFMQKCLDHSGLGPIQCFPDCVMEMLKDVPSLTQEELFRGVPFAGRIQEAEYCSFTTVSDLFKKTGIHPSEVGIVMTSCDCFGPQPSTSAMIVNQFKLREDVLTYSMTGMGCANGGVCIDMAKHLLKSNPETLVLVFNHENISSGGYLGNDPSMLLPYCLFRVSGAAAFISNRQCDVQRAKYELVTTVRTHYGKDDKANMCISEAIDSAGLPGIRINKDVVPSAKKALTSNLVRLGKKTLPISELVRVALDRKHKPDFKKAFEHFLIQVGGSAVLDHVEMALQLPKDKMQPSRDSLYRFANTAGAASWYTLLSLESTAGLKKNDRVLAIMFGAGFKAISVVWKARRDINEIHPAWVAMGSAD